MNTLLRQAGLAAPRNGVANLVFFQVRGDCLAPDIRDGDMLFATWRPAPVSQARLDAGELAVFLIQDAGTGQVCALLKRWRGILVGGNGSGETTVRLASERGVRSFPAGRVHLLADHVRLAHRVGDAHSGTLQRGKQYSTGLLAGTVHAGAGDDDVEGFVPEGFVPEDDATLRLVKTSVTEILADVGAHVAEYAKARWGLAGAEPHEWLAAWGPRAVYALFRPPYDGEPFVARLTDGRLNRRYSCGITEMCVLQAVPGVEGRCRNCLCGTEFDLDGRQLIVYGALSRQEKWNVLPYKVPDGAEEQDDLVYLAQVMATEV